VDPQLARSIDDQSGVVSRRQVLSAGFDDAFIEKQLRNRVWSRVYAGVYVSRTGPLTWEQRAWAAVLFYAPAALCHQSALVTTDSWATIGPATPVHVAIEHPRKCVKVDGVRLHRLVDLERRVLWNMSPPRLRVEEAVLDVCADSRTRTAALAVASDACQQRRTTAARLLTALSMRRRIRFGGWLHDALQDVAEGALSVLENTYLRRVERAHGLPRARRQLSARTEDGPAHRDVEYEDFELVVELDGRIGHEAIADRWDDMERDLLVAVEEKLSIRVGWRQAEERPCVTADRLAKVLQQRGWDGEPVSCGPTCVVKARKAAQPGRSPVLGAGNRPR
jgi:hypothetical protein